MHTCTCTRRCDVCLSLLIKRKCTCERTENSDFPIIRPWSYMREITVHEMWRKSYQYIVLRVRPDLRQKEEGATETFHRGVYRGSRYAIVWRLPTLGYSLSVVLQCCTNEIIIKSMKSPRRRESTLRPAPYSSHAVFAGPGLYSARRGIDSLDRISLSSTVLAISLLVQYWRAPPKNGVLKNEQAGISPSPCRPMYTR